MSLSNDQGSCESVLVPLSGTYYVDRSGNWENTAGFQYSDAVYQFTFASFLGDEAAFSDLMKTFQSNMQALSLITLNNDLAFNLVVWSAYSARIQPNSNSGIQTLFLSASPQYIFNLNYQIGTISDVNADCGAPVDTYFDAANSALVSSRKCNAQLLHHADSLFIVFAGTDVQVFAVFEQVSV